MSETNVVTSFVVVVPEEGISYAILGSPEGLEGVRTPQVADVRRACLEIAADLNAQSAAQYAATLLNPPQPPEVPDIVREALERRAEDAVE